MHKRKTAQPQGQSVATHSFDLRRKTQKNSDNSRANIFFVILTALVLALLLIVLAQPGPQANLAKLLQLDSNLDTEQPQAIDYSQIETVKVARVVDGDTLILQDSRRVRYLNVDTPESAHPNKPIQCYGKEAFELNKSLVEGKTVWLKFDKQKEDRYGRLLALVFLPGRNVNDVRQSVNAYLVKTGFARSYILKPNDTYAKEFAAMELEARKSNLGLWKECPKPFEE